MHVDSLIGFTVHNFKKFKGAKRLNRIANAQDIELPTGYVAEVVYAGINVPTAMVFAEDGTVYITDAGLTDGNGKILVWSGETWHVIADGFTPPLLGVTYDHGRFYIAHRGKVTVMKRNGARKNIVTGLPSLGDHYNNPIAIDRNGKLYFGQGTATNSGVVGEDNRWLKEHPYFHDNSGHTVALAGRNFASHSALAPSDAKQVSTGAFLPYGVQSAPGQWIPGVVRASGSIIAVNADGSGLEQIASGFRNPYGLAFDKTGRLWTLDHGMDERGSRPVANCPDAMYEVRRDAWYGWPDFAAGEAVTHPVFASGGIQPEFLLTTHPMTPPHPFAAFAPHSAATGFSFSTYANFGFVGHAFIAEIGSFAPATTAGKRGLPVGQRISRVDMANGELEPFAWNRVAGAGGGGFERPVTTMFGPDGALYVIDMGVMRGGSEKFAENTGVIWRISRG